jgi:hypothetical protein
VTAKVRDNARRAAVRDGFDGELAVRGDGTEQDVLSRRFAVKMRLSLATTAPARAPRRSVRLAAPHTAHMPCRPRSITRPAYA